MDELIIKKSRFISYVFEVQNKEQIKQIIQKLKEENKKAIHICYGYFFVDKNNVSHAGFNDDGEPKNTAGKPIYEIIQLKKAINLLVVVVRYFGGTLLGSSGLIKAYRKSASLAINSYNLNKRG